MTDKEKRQEYARKFKYKCPYDNRSCYSFRCLDCAVEKKRKRVGE